MIQAQRAYLLTGVPVRGRSTQVKFTIDASESSPVVNPAFVIKGWGQLPPEVHIDGASLAEGEVETGFIDTLSGTDLVLWLHKTATSRVQVALSTTK